MMRKGGRCWPASSRGRSSWQVAARGGAGHASQTWRQWMEPVRPSPNGNMPPHEVGRDAARMAPEKHRRED